MSPDGLPTYGDSSGRVSSTRLALLWRNVNSRTRSPTVTASSTSADMIRGVETLTSTPQASVNSHSLFGWLTRPTVRGTANSVFASSEVTRLTLSSPVAAMTTSQRSRPASSSDDSSHESASSHSASGTRSGLMARGSLSMSSTWWPLVISSRAIERPTAPAPAMATLTRSLLRPLVDDVVRAGGVLLAHHQVKQVALLDHALGRRQHALAEPVDPRDPGLRGGLEVDGTPADPGRRGGHLVDPDRARRVAEVGLGADREQPTKNLVGGPLHGRDGGDAEALVDLGPSGVVDPGDHLVDAERLARHPGRDDVGVVTARDCRERVGPADAGLLEYLLVEAVAGDLVAVEAGPQATKAVGHAVDDRDGVVALLQTSSEGRSDPPTSHDHHVHGETVSCDLVSVGDVSKRI